jgi:hypothetical protein
MKFPEFRAYQNKRRRLDGQHEGVVTLTAAGRLEGTSGTIEPIMQPAEGMSPAARY